jgi:cytochrome c553
MRRVSAIALAIACLVFGAVAQRIYDARRLANASAVAQRTVPPEPAPPIAAPPVAAPPRMPFASIQFDHEPLWAYGYEQPPKPDDKAVTQGPPNRNLQPNQSAEEQTRPRHIAGSQAAYSLVDIRDGQNVIDWFPDDHPPMPDVMAHGPARLGKLRRGCAQCHLPNGKGRPENAPTAGLPVSYIVRQLEDFRTGLRYSAEPRKPNTNTMVWLASAMTEDELKAAAEYFSSTPYTPWIRVIETALVPKTRIVDNLYLPVEAARTEPIAGRIIEVPEDQEQSELYRNTHSGFVAYVPPGSIAKGKDLATTGGVRIVGDRIVQGKTTACITCHGPDLMGIGDVPPIAGRSPSYTVRQLWDFQQGTRRGISSQLMKMVVANLSEEDLVDIAAYVASRPPTPVAAPPRVAR